MTTTRRRPTPAAGAALAAALAAGALPAGATPGPADRPTVVLTRVGGLGTVVATPSHQVLYLFTHDHRGTSTCRGACAAVWPPYLLAPGQRTVHPPRGLRGLGTLHRGTRFQVSLDGHPLYRFAGDRRPGQDHGEGVGHAWFAVGPSGRAVHPTTAGPSLPAPTGPTTPTTPAPTTTPTAPPVGGTTPPAPTPAAHPPPTTVPVTPPTTPPTAPPATTPATAPPATTTTAPGGYGY